MPYISVVVPVYNAERSIEKCVSSIVKQRFTDMEILLIDDGSQDASGVLCDKLAEGDARVRVVHKENQGVSAARNSGIDSASGNYILFVDSDDYLPEFYVEELVKAQEESGGTAFCWTAVQIVSENGSVKEERLSYSEEIRAAASRRDVLKFSARGLLNAPWNKLYHMDIIKEKHLRMKEEISIAEDLLFNLQYLDAAGECQIVILNKVPYYYVRNGQVSLDNGYKKNFYAIHKKVLGILWNHCEKWRAPKEDIPLFYKRYWEYMQNAFANLEERSCPLSGFARFAEKCRITADRHFQESITQKKGTMGRGSYLMWKSRIYLFVWLYEKICFIRKEGNK